MFGDVLGMDATLLALSRLSAAPGALGEYNGKFMCKPVRSTRRFVRYLAQPYSPKLSQFLPTGKNAGSLQGSGSHAIHTMNR